jgi:hypothetical protein
MLGDLLAWMAITLGSILEFLGSFVSLLGRLWVACGLHWVRQGAQMSYLALRCRREHQFEGPGGREDRSGSASRKGLWPGIATSCDPFKMVE